MPAMRKVDDLVRNIKTAEAHIDTAIALIAQAEGPERSLFEGYTASQITRELRESLKGIVRARDRAVELSASGRRELVT